MLRKQLSAKLLDVTHVRAEMERNVGDKLKRRFTIVRNDLDDVEHKVAVPHTGGALYAVVLQLGRVAYNPDLHDLILTANFHHPLAILLHADAATGQVQEAALQAIATLTSYARHQEAISAVGVLRPLLRILSEGSQSTMSRSAAEALRNLARTEKMKEVLREDGGFAPIFNGACWLDVLAPAHFRHLLANPHPHVRALTPMGPLPLPAAPRPAAPCPDAPHPAAPRSKRPSLKTPLVRSPFRSAAG